MQDTLIASTDVTIACNLVALSDRQRRRRAELATLLKVDVIEVSDLPNGYAFHLLRRPETEGQIEELIALEERCCSFLKMEAHVPANGETLDVEMTGGEGVKAFVAGQFGTRGKLEREETS